MVDIGLSQTDLAGLVGATRSAVNKVLHTMAAGGLTALEPVELGLLAPEDRWVFRRTGRGLHHLAAKCRAYRGAAAAGRRRGDHRGLRAPVHQASAQPAALGGRVLA